MTNLEPGAQRRAALETQQPASLEILHAARWMDALTARAPARAASLPQPSSRAGWHTSIAVRPDQVRAAEELVQRRYVWRGYKISSEAATRSGDNSRVVLLAKKGNDLMGTLTVRPDSPYGLLAEKTYAEEVEQMRRDGRRLGELVRLALEEGADWKATLDALVQSTYLITRVVHGLTDLVIEVNPRHVSFHQRVFGFAVAAAERFCERVGAPSVLLRGDLERFAQRLQLAA